MLAADLRHSHPSFAFLEDRHWIPDQGMQMSSKSPAAISAPDSLVRRRVTQQAQYVSPPDRHAADALSKAAARLSTASLVSLN